MHTARCSKVLWPIERCIEMLIYYPIQASLPIRRLRICCKLASQCLEINALSYREQKRERERDGPSTSNPQDFAAWTLWSAMHFLDLAHWNRRPECRRAWNHCEKRFIVRLDPPSEGSTGPHSVLYDVLQQIFTNRTVWAIPTERGSNLERFQVCIFKLKRFQR